MSIKEQLIRDLISNYDFADKNWSLSAIESKLHKFLGEIPAINVVYKKDVILYEGSKEPKESLEIEKIEIIFFDLDDKFKKLEFSIL